MNNFIAEYEHLIEPEVCKKLIRLFEDGHKKKLSSPGATGWTVDKKRKDSTDLPVSAISPQLKKRYEKEMAYFFEKLGQAHDQYVEAYPILKAPGTYAHGVYDFQIQRYYPNGQAYHAWHYENGHPKAADRLLAWMCYLNAVDEGGETEFVYYDKKVKPTEGTILIWPAGFTHAHRGVPSSSDTKYIITGWFQFTP